MIAYAFLSLSVPVKTLTVIVHDFRSRRLENVNIIVICIYSQSLNAQMGVIFIECV
jgi:Flp pilus assembly protein protease CpaA